MTEEEREQHILMLRAQASRRFTLLWIGQISTILLTLLCSTTLILKGQSIQVVTVTGLAGLALSNIWPMLKQEQNEQIAAYHRSLIESKVEVAAERAKEVADKVDQIEKKTNGNLTKAVHEVAEEVKRAAHEPAPGQEAMPRTREELDRLMREFAKNFCDDMVMERIEEKLAEAFKRQKQLMKDLGNGI